MSNNGEETELQPLVENDKRDSELDGHTDEDSVDGRNHNDSSIVEVDEIMLPEDRLNVNVKLPVQPNSQALQEDETDNESFQKKGSVIDRDEEEPRLSFQSPVETEETVQASDSPDALKPQICCFLSRSRYLQKKCSELFHAVNYHRKKNMEKILHDEQDRTLVELFIRRDASGKPCIMKAITRQSISCIEPLLEKLKNLNFDSYNIDKMKALESDDGKNILHVAAEMLRDEETINSIDILPIIAKLADRPDSNGATPLIIACKHQNGVMARRLVSYRAKIDHFDKDNNSPIYFATATGSADTLLLFLVCGVRNSKNQLELFKNHELYKNKGTILQAVLESRSPKTLQVLVAEEKGKHCIAECLREELNLENNKTFIHDVCETPLVHLVQLAIRDTELVLKRLDKDDATPLMKATEAGQLGIVQLILSTHSGKQTLSCQKKCTKETALMIACRKGFSDIVKHMMESSDTEVSLRQMDQDGKNAFHHAAKNDQVLSVMIDVCKRTGKFPHYENYLNSKDSHGYVALHHAAAAGLHKNVRLLLENKVSYDIPSVCGRTALHYAACSNIETVNVLLEFVARSSDDLKEFIDVKDSRLQTSLHIAAALGKWHTVSLLLERGASIECDKEKETPLHLASYIGCTRTIYSLITRDQTIINFENRVGETAAMFAAVSGQTEALEMLLENGAKLWAPSHCNSVEKRKTCLDWAVINGQPETAKAILNKKDWNKTMKKSCYGADGLLARMVNFMPSVALEVLKKCQTNTPYGATQYDFFALQTTKELKPCGEMSKHVTAMEALETMAKHSRNECLSHPVVQKFLDQKWALRARKWYLICLFIYTLFLTSLTIYITLVTEGGLYSSSDSCMVTRVVLYLFASLSVIKELFQLYHRKLGYFCIVSTYLELIMYICVFVFLPNETKSNAQLEAGAIAIFLGWINYIWFLKRFQTFGIYVIMAKKMLVTFIKVFVPVSFFVIAFSMTFFVLLHDRDEEGAFENIIRSFVTSFAMMVGEVDYRGTFLKQSGATSALILVFLVFFLVLMSILLMNLLTGLAVGDIGVIMKRSLAEKRIQQANLIVEMDKYLNKYPGLGATYLEPLEIKNQNGCPTTFQKLMQILFPNFDIEEEKDKKAEGCEMTRMKRQLDAMQNTLEEIKQSFKLAQVARPMKNTETMKERRNTIM